MSRKVVSSGNRYRAKVDRMVLILPWAVLVGCGGGGGSGVSPGAGTPSAVASESRPGTSAGSASSSAGSASSSAGSASSSGASTATSDPSPAASASASAASGPSSSATSGASPADGGGSHTGSAPAPALDRLLRWQAPTHNTDGSPLTDLAGYRIYWGTESGAYGHPHTIGDPAVTQWRADMAPGTYFFALTAFDHDGVESGYSNELVKTIP